MDAFRTGQILGQALLGLLCGGLLLAAVAMAADVAERSDVPVEAVSATIVAVAVGSTALVALGVITMAVTKNRDILVLSTAAAGLFLLSIAGLFSIGILILPLAIGSVYLLVRRSAGRTGLIRAALAGISIAVGIAALFVVWAQPPLVECRETGASTSSRPWWNSGISMGQSTEVESDGSTSRGAIETPGGRYVFSCRDGELTRFRRFSGN